MIADDPLSPMMAMVMAMDGPVKVVQDEEPREPEPRTPEGIRDPRIQITVIRGRRIVGDNGWTLFIVIMVDHFGIGILPVILNRFGFIALIFRGNRNR